jgi:hypothetical protein
MTTARRLPGLFRPAACATRRRSIALELERHNLAWQRIGRAGTGSWTASCGSVLRLRPAVQRKKARG